MIGTTRNDINSSEYLHKLHGVEFSPVPHFDVQEELAVQQAVTALINKKLISSAHDVSEGGLFITLMESCFNNNVGFKANQSNTDIRPDAYWFGEGQSRIVISAAPENKSAIETLLKEKNISFEELGTVSKNEISIDNNNWGTISSWKEKYDNAITNLLAGHESEHALSAL